jgi:flagellar biosynthesis protein
MRDAPAMPFAAALQYDMGKSAPRVTAKGRGAVAEEIVRVARLAGVALHESPELASLLMEVDLDQPIPPQLYRVIAELLAWIYRIEGVTVPQQQPSAHPISPLLLPALQHG